MRVGLFVTCLVDLVSPEVGVATARVLQRAGHEVVFPEGQTCCGQPAFNAGYRDEAATVLRSTLQALASAKVDAYVAPAGSCTTMIRTFADGLLGESADLDAVKPRLYELSEFLVDVLGVTDVGASFPHRVTYHPTCHSLRMLRVGDRPRRLLSEVRGIDLVELEDADECCGFGGTFAVKNAETSMAMLSDKLRRVLDTRAEVCTAADNSCLMHIGGALRRQRAGVRTVHLAEILAAQE